jgi:ribosome-associated protein
VFLNKNSLAIAKMAAAAAEDKKAQDTTILKINKLTLIADYFVITSGDSEPQLKAISNFVMRKLKENKIRLLHYEGKPGTGWILLDYGDVIVHIFSKEKRDFYDLEYIWQEANKVRLLKRKKMLKEEKQ